jgi:hypothetical protein
VKISKSNAVIGFLYRKLAEKILYHLTFVKKWSKLGDGLFLENFYKYKRWKRGT